MNKKQVAVLFVIFSFLAVLAYAKPKDQQEKPVTAADIVAKLTVQLGLDDKQLDEIKPIIENYLEQEKQLKIAETKQLSKVLTSDQMYAWNSLQLEESKKKKKHSKF